MGLHKLGAPGGGGGTPARGPPGALGASSLRFAPARTPIRPSGWRQQAGG